MSDSIFKKIAIWIICLLGLSQERIIAQQDALYSQYMFNPLVINPGYAGTKGVLSATLVYRNQWLGMDGAPTTQTLSVHSPLKSKRISLGMYLFNDKIGAMRLMGVMTSYAYAIHFGKSTLSMGLQAGFSNYRFDYQQLKIYDSGDSKFLNDEKLFVPDFNFGLYYYSNKYYLGATIDHMLESKVFLPKNKQNVFGLVRHYKIMGGYAFVLRKKIIIKPSFLLNYVPSVPVNLDINTNIYFYKKLGVGFSFRTSNALVFLLEYQIDDNFYLGYSYDYSLGELGGIQSGSHEIMVGYDINLFKEKLIPVR